MPSPQGPSRSVRREKLPCSPCVGDPTSSAGWKLCGTFYCAQSSASVGAKRSPMRM